MTPLWALSLWASLAVETTGECPSARAVEERLGELASAGDTQAARARISGEGQVLTVEILGRDGQALAERSLAAEGSCQDRAEAAAVVVAAWLLAHAPATAGAASAQQESAVPVESAVVHARHVPAARWEAAAMLGVVANGDGVAPAVRVEGGFAPRGGRLSLRATSLAAGPSDATLAGGQARWLRAGLGLGLGYRLSGGWLAADVHADLLAGLIRVSGADFDDSRVSWGMDGGAAAGIRLFGGHGRVRAAVAVVLTGWLGEHRAEVGGSLESRAIPRVEGLVTAGVVVLWGGR